MYYLSDLNRFTPDKIQIKAYAPVFLYILFTFYNF